MSTRAAPVRRFWLSWPLVAAAAACVVGGFADLANGGTPLGALLLVGGYCVAVPAALLVPSRRERG